MAHVLVIDDDEVFIPGQVRQLFPAPAHRVEVSATGGAGIDRVRKGPTITCSSRSTCTDSGA
jgi:hypothetical protein